MNAHNDIPARVSIPHRVRASDAEREQVAVRVQAAGAAGRLTIDETGERLGAVYDTRFLDDLTALTADLPPERTPRRAGPPRALRIHAAVAGVLAVLLIVRWLVAGPMFFWPIVPLTWLAVSLLVHAGVRRGLAGRRRPVVQY